MSKLKNWFIDSFPAPELMTMPAAALDISPNSIKYLDGKYTSDGCLPQVFDEVFLDEGTIVNGVIKDEDALIKALSSLRKKHKSKFVSVAIPENALYLYTMQLSGRPSRSAVLQQIEFTASEHVPINIEDSVYGFDVVSFARNSTFISVTVAPIELISGYERVLSRAGFTVLSIELEAYAVARAVSALGSGSVSNIGVEMVLDIGYERAGIIIVRNGLPIFTVTISGGSKAIDVVIDECKKQYTFWDTRTNHKGHRIERVAGVIVCGGSSKEMIEPLSAALKVDVELANIWQNLFDINNFVPMIDAKEALAMATLAGLLLNNKK